MLELIPQWLGQSLGNWRAGHEKLVIADSLIDPGTGTMQLTSTAFASGARLPERFTDDGEGASPPLSWSGVPADARALSLIVEDPDAPLTQPLVHAIVWGMQPETDGLSEGAIGPTEDARIGKVGQNSYLHTGWLPPDPPTGHGEHDYVFQLFALSECPELSERSGRSEVVDAMKDRILAAAVLVGTYSRGDGALADVSIRKPNISDPPLQPEAI